MSKYYLRSNHGWYLLSDETLKSFKLRYADGVSLDNLTYVINSQSFYKKVDKTEVSKLISQIKRTPEGQELYLQRKAKLDKERSTKYEKCTGTRFKYICPNCNEEFTTDHPRKVYCSQNCQLEMQKKSRSEGRQSTPDRTYYSKPDPEEVYKQSFEVDYKGEESLFCDTEFLEQFFRKKIKKTDGCK